MKFWPLLLTWTILILYANSNLLHKTVIRHQDAVIAMLSSSCPNIQLGTMVLEHTGIIEHVDISKPRTCIYDIDPWQMLRENSKKNRKY